MPNLTIRIDDKELIRQARTLAAKQGTSLSAIVRRFLYELIRRDDEYERARIRAVQLIRKGLRLGGRPLSRQEVYNGRLG